MIRLNFDVARPGFRLDVALELPLRGVTAVFGASGSGKTTFLRCVAGLERARPGRLAVGEEVWQDEARAVFLPPWRRPLGYVFQEPRLFPHLSVRGNLSYGLRRTAAAKRRVAWERVIEILGIGHLLERGTAALSGGEAQRVAIGRALLASPRLLLMDEPLAALDPARKNEVLPFLARLRRELDIPVLYVTHNVDEVLRIADTMVLMEFGRVRATGPVAELLGRPDLGHLTGERDAGAVVEARIAAHDERFGLTSLAVAGRELKVPHVDAPPGTGLRLRIHARDVSVALKRPEAISILNVLPARILEIGDASGPVVDVRLDAGAVLWARLSARSVHDLELAPGREVYALIKSIAFDRDGVDAEASPTSP